MRRLIVSLLVPIAACASVAPAGGTPTVGGPVIRIATPEPVAISGVRFASSERVTVRLVVRGVGTFTKVVRTTPAGRLTARFAIGLPECPGYAIFATGSLGSRATLRQLPPPCGIVIQP